MQPLQHGSLIRSTFTDPALDIIFNDRLKTTDLSASDIIMKEHQEVLNGLIKLGNGKSNALVGTTNLLQIASKLSYEKQE